MSDTSFTATIIKEDKEGGWTYLIWPESAAFFGTRKAVKVKFKIDGHDFQASFLPWGDGTHMLPIRKAILTAIEKQAGDTVEVSIVERL